MFHTGRYRNDPRHNPALGLAPQADGGCPPTTIRLSRRAALLGALPLAACASLGGREPLTVDVVGVEPLAGQGMEGRFLVKLRLQNPGETPVDFDGVSVAWTCAAAAWPAVWATCAAPSPLRRDRDRRPRHRPGQRHDPPGAGLSPPATAPGSTSVRKRWALLGMTWKRCCGARRGSCARRGSVRAGARAEDQRRVCARGQGRDRGRPGVCKAA